MSLWSTIITGIQQGFRFRRVAVYILLIQLLLATMIGIMAYSYIQDSIGHTTQLLKIIEGYDHDVLQDLLLFESTGWSMIKSFTGVVILLYLFLGPFIMGGLLHAYQQHKDRWDIFWNGGSRYYFSFLRLNLIVLAFLLITLVLLGAVGGFLTVYGLENFVTELPILYGIGSLILFFLLIGMLLITASTQAKWMILLKGVGPWAAFKSGWKKVRQQWWFFVGIGLIFFVLTLGFAILINYLINCIPESGFLLVLLALLLQVVALYVRVCLRNGYYHAIINS